MSKKIRAIAPVTGAVFAVMIPPLMVAEEAMRYVILATALLLAACETTSPNNTTTPPKDTMDDELEAAWSDCDSRFKAGELPNWVARAHCINDGRDRILRQYNYRDMDLQNLFAAKRVELSERLDGSAITKAQYDLEWAQLVSQVVSELERRIHLRSSRSSSDPPLEIDCDVFLGWLECTTR